jgi:hypothetical protein
MGLYSQANGIMQWGRKRVKQLMWNGSTILCVNDVRIWYGSDPARKVRFGIKKTLSFSKREDRHELRIRGFVDVYNAPLEAKVKISQQ